MEKGSTGTFLLISGIFFGLVSLIHLIRGVSGWPFIIGSHVGVLVCFPVHRWIERLGLSSQGQIIPS